jgi:hypothetical protein
MLERAGIAALPNIENCLLRAASSMSESACGSCAISMISREAVISLRM